MHLAISKTENTKKHYVNSKPTIVLMTKWHAIFRCKSRLAKDIGAFKAAKIQEKLTNHTINVAKEIQKEDTESPVVWKLMRSSFLSYFLSYYTPKFFA